MHERVNEWMNERTSALVGNWVGVRVSDERVGEWGTGECASE